MNKYDPNYKHNPVIFHIGQKIVIFNKNKQVLFLKRSDKCTRPGGWDFPGGGLENEQPVEGIIRETKEETNLQIANIKIIDSITHHQSDHNTLIIGYMADYKSGELKLSWEHNEYIWLNIKKALELDLPQGHSKFLLKAISIYTKNNG